MKFHKAQLAPLLNPHHSEMGLFDVPLCSNAKIQISEWENAVRLQNKNVKTNDRINTRDLQIKRTALIRPSAAQWEQMRKEVKVEDRQTEFGQFCCADLKQSWSTFSHVAKRHERPSLCFLFVAVGQHAGYAGQKQQVETSGLKLYFLDSVRAPLPQEKDLIRNYLKGHFFFMIHSPPPTFARRTVPSSMPAAEENCSLLHVGGLSAILIGPEQQGVLGNSRRKKKTQVFFNFRRLHESNVQYRYTAGPTARPTIT